MKEPGGEGSYPPLASGGSRSASRGRPGRPRWAAVLALSLSAVGLVVLGVESVERRVRAARHRPPFSAGAAEAVAPDGSVWTARNLRRPAVVLYVVWSCRHCTAALSRWAALGPAGVLGPDVDLRIVAPEPPPDGALPEPLRGRALVDRNASTARSLGAHIVPTTAYLAPGGRVIARTQGRTTDGRIRRSLLRLREASARAASP